MGLGIYAFTIWFLLPAILVLYCAKISRISMIPYLISVGAMSITLVLLGLSIGFGVYYWVAPVTPAIGWVSIVVSLVIVLIKGGHFFNSGRR
jgi:putative Mn2+ efflux pump MntP